MIREWQKRYTFEVTQTQVPVLTPSSTGYKTLDSYF